MKIKIIKLSILIIFIVTGGLIGNEYSNYIMSNDWQLIFSKATNLLNNGKSITAGNNISVNGSFKKNRFTLNSGGFSVYTFKKNTSHSGFIKKIQQSKDLKIEANTRREKTDYYYETAFDYLISQSPFSQNKIDEIQKFPYGFDTKYHYFYAPENQDEYNYQIFWSSEPNGLENENMGDSRLDIFQKDIYSLEVLQNSTNYIIAEKKNNLYVINTIIGIIIGLLTSLLLFRIFKKKSKKPVHNTV
tara:strand:+ start:878 stop:1612 length:735 start_codon:yes stop_codon:yes gene_type:complete